MTQDNRRDDGGDVAMWVASSSRWQGGRNFSTGGRRNEGLKDRRTEGQELATTLSLVDARLSISTSDFKRMSHPVSLLEREAQTGDAIRAGRRDLGLWVCATQEPSTNHREPGMRATI